MCGWFFYGIFISLHNIFSHNILCLKVLLKLNLEIIYSNILSYFCILFLVTIRSDNVRRTAVINFKNFDSFYLFIKRNRLLIILMLLFFGGLFSGVVLYDRQNELCVSFSKYLIGEYSRGGDFGFWNLLFDNFLNFLLLIAVCFCVGSSILGVILSPMCMYICGVIYGLLSASLYSQFALKGVAFYAVMVLPSAVFVIIALLFAVKESVNFSFSLARLIMPNYVTKNITIEFKEYCIRYVIICLITLLAALVEALLACNLSGSFVLN